MAIASIVISLLSLALMWLVLPTFVLAPLALYLGWKSHVANQLANPTPAGWAELRSLLPMTIAASAFVLGMYWLNTGHNV